MGKEKIPSRIVTRIKNKLNEQDIVIIGIEGGPASGKTSAAESLALHCLSNENCFVLTLCTDMFHRWSNSERQALKIKYDSWYDWYDFVRIRYFLEAVRGGANPIVLENLWNIDSGKKDKNLYIQYPPEKKLILIMEGCFILHEDLVHLIDEKVFIDVPLVQRIDRQIKRDIDRGRRRKVPEYQAIYEEYSDYLKSNSALVF
jgi:uridine kinase